MQTFLPLANFAESARVLDRQRLGKQRVEAWQILKALRFGGGWKNHPAVKMWRGYENALRLYGQAICTEWIVRGYRDTMLKRFSSQRRAGIVMLPPWLGDVKFHRSHKSNLLRKFPEHYRKFWPTLRDDLPYVWPTEKD